MNNIVEIWKKKNPNLNIMKTEGQKKFAQDTCPSTFSKKEVEMELNYLMEVITEDLKSELGLKRTTSLLEDLKINYLLKYPNWENLIDGRIEELEEEVA
jgi:hypothetical protein